MRRPAAALTALAASLGLLAACDGQARGPLITRALQPNPAGAADKALDVAIRAPAGEGVAALFVATGAGGLDVHRIDGSHLQRLGSTPVTALAIVADLPVGAVPADILIAADPDAGLLRAFEIQRQTGALRRIARSNATPGGPVTSLCAWRDAEGRHRLVVTTAAPALEEWSLEAAAGKIPGRANEIVAAPLRSSPLDFPASDCAVDPSVGDVYLLDPDGHAWRVAGEWTADAAPERAWEEAGLALRGITAHHSDGVTQLLATGSDGSLFALAPDGRLLARTRLDVPAGRLAAGGGLLGIVAADGSGARIAPLGQALGSTGASR